MLGKLGFHSPPCLPRQTWSEGQAGLHHKEAVMGKLLAALDRLLLCSVLLALPAIVFAQINTIAITRVWTQDEKGQDKFLFLPGNPVRYAVIVNNTYGHTITAKIRFEASGPNFSTTICSPTGLQTGCFWNPAHKSIYLYEQDIELPVGLSAYYSPYNIPSDAHTGPYGISIEVGWPPDTGGYIKTVSNGYFTVEDTLPYPSWWNSAACDTSIVSNSAPLGAYFRGTPACGPIHLPAIDKYITHFASGTCGEYEWQCVELSMRFMYLAYGIEPYCTDTGGGDSLVDSYNAHNDGNRILVPVANNVSGQAGPLPDPGDILSYNYDAVNHVGHTSVVVASQVYSGNGFLEVMEQNFSPNGKAKLQVENWHVSGVKNWLHHTLDIWPQSGHPNTSVLMYGQGFQPNEAINLYFDVFLTEITADRAGTFLATIQVPNLPPNQYPVTVIGATTTPTTRTVFYITQ
jgi:hypothetical protein